MLGRGLWGRFSQPETGRRPRSPLPLSSCGRERGSRGSWKGCSDRCPGPSGTRHRLGSGHPPACHLGHSENAAPNITGLLQHFIYTLLFHWPHSRAFLKLIPVGFEREVLSKPGQLQRPRFSWSFPSNRCPLCKLWLASTHLRLTEWMKHGDLMHQWV